jgi:catechol 2,3-dioxygenase-like lactoylglutathione lyase family enzyme
MRVKMIGYVLFGTNNLKKSLDFYDHLLEPLNLKRGPHTERVHLYTDGNGPMFGICTPADGKVATSGNGTMIAINVASSDKVDFMQTHAEKLNATHVSDVNEEVSSGFYGVYVRDLDNNKICFYKMDM